MLPLKIGRSAYRSLVVFYASQVERTINLAELGKGNQLFD